MKWIHGFIGEKGVLSVRLKYMERDYSDPWLSLSVHIPCTHSSTRLFLFHHLRTVFM